MWNSLPIGIYKILYIRYCHKRPTEYWLIKDNNKQRFSRGDENGLPVLGSGGGNRSLYTTQFGLVGACLYSDRVVDSSYDLLRGFYGGGRVVVLSAAGARENF